MVSGISNYRQKELLYRCKQYPEWKEMYNLSILNCNAMGPKSKSRSGTPNPTYTAAKNADIYRTKMTAVERAAKDAGREWKNYILAGVIEDRKYEDFRNPPFTKQQYRDMLKLFYILLDERWQ